MSHARHHAPVGLHHITWRATGSAVSDVGALVDALAWLVGDADDVKTDKSSSYHGPDLTLVSATTGNKRRAVRSFARLGASNIRSLVEVMEQQMEHYSLIVHKIHMG